MYSFHHLFTAPKFTKFFHDVARSSQMNFVKSKWRYCNPFSERLGIKMNSHIWTILTLKLVVMATSLEPSGKGINAAIYDQISTLW